MLSEEAIKTIRNAVKFKYDEHVSRLLAIPEKHLNKIVPNQGVPIVEMLQGHNADTAEEIRRYGEVLQSELAKMIEKLGLNDFTEEDKGLILQLMEDYCSPDIYKKRFKIMLDSIERKIKSYGMAFDIINYRADIPKSSCAVDSENSIRKIKAIISNELNCHIVRNQSNSCPKINTGLAEEMNKIAQEDRIQNQQIALSMGERTFDMEKLSLMKGFITAFTNKNIAVVNMDKEIGYLLAEGSGFLSPEKYKEVCQKNVDRLNERTSGVSWRFTPGNEIYRFTVNIYSRDANRTIAKVGITLQVLGNQPIKSHELPPFMLTAMYEELWRELEKSLFIQRETK
jgi:hypothetical protein